MIIALRQADIPSPTAATRILFVGTVLALLACLAFVASPLRYAQQDVPLGPAAT